MAQVTLNPLIKELSGTVGALVFYSNMGRQYARRHVVPRNPDTAAQKINRACFADAVRGWQALPVYQREQWNRKSAILQISGYNLFISRFMSSARKPLQVFSNGAVKVHVSGLSVSDMVLLRLSENHALPQKNHHCSFSLNTVLPFVP